MLSLKTIRATIHLPTKCKLSILADLNTRWNRAVELAHDGKSYKEIRSEIGLTSGYATKAVWIAKKSNSPITVGREIFRISDTSHPHARFFLRLTIEPREFIWLPLRMSSQHEAHLSDPTVEVREAQLIQKKNRWEFHITIQRDIPAPLISSHAPVLSVDIGERFLSATVLSDRDSITSAKLSGRRVREIRRHYAWLRKRLGEKKLLRVIKQVGDTEHRKVDAVCHEISREIVNRAKEAGAVIVVGSLRNLRKRTKGKGKRLNRIVSGTPYNRLTTYIQYKAAWDGVPVVLANEDYTSMECHRCHEWGKRPSQGRFICPNCRLEYNADLNAAINIAQRFRDHGLRDGVLGFAPIEGGRFL